MADAVFRGVATRMDFAPIWRSGSSMDSDCWRRTMQCCAKVEYILLYFSVSLLLRAFASFAMALRAGDQSWRVFAPFEMVIGESWKLKESREIIESWRFCCRPTAARIKVKRNGKKFSTVDNYTVNFVFTFSYTVKWRWIFFSCWNTSLKSENRRKMRLYQSILALLVLQLIDNCYSYIITVDSHAEECFFDTGECEISVCLPIGGADGRNVDFNDYSHVWK